jgi:hypothetical protein
MPDDLSFFLYEHQERCCHGSEDNGKIKGRQYADPIPQQPGNQGGGKGAKTNAHLKDT